MTLTRRSVFALATAAVLLPRRAGAAGDILRLAGGWPIRSFDPGATGALLLSFGVTETLVGVDTGGAAAPSLAIGWQVAEDKMRWRFKLRHDVKFHDGTPLTPDIVIDNLRRARERSPILQAVPLAALRADRDSIILTTERPFMALPSVLTHPDTTILSPNSFDGSGRIRQPIATGPMRYGAHRTQTQIAFAGFSMYWGAKPAFDGLTYIVAENAETRAAALESGAAEIATGLSLPAAERLRRNPSLRIIVGLSPQLVQLKLNLRDPALSGAATRRALDIAIDKSAIARSLFRQEGAAANQLLPATVTLWHDATLPVARPDTGTARALLAQDGWSPGSDGALSKNGQPFLLEILTYANRPELAAVAEVLQQQWRSIGIDTRVALVETANIFRRHADKTLQAALVSRSYGVSTDPIDAILADFSTASGSFYGPLDWNSSEIRSHIERYLAASNSTDAHSAATAIIRLIMTDLPIIPIAWAPQSLGFAAPVTDVNIPPAGIRPFTATVKWHRS